MTAQRLGGSEYLALSQIDRLQQLLQSGAVTSEHLEWFMAQSHEERDRLVREKIETPTLVELLNDETRITLPALHGSKKLQASSHVFKRVIFEKCCINQPKRSTLKAIVHRYKVTKSATFSEIFRSFSVPLDQLSFSQEQIVVFCERYPDELRQESFTFFLFKENNDFFVATVFFGKPDALHVNVYKFGNDIIWEATLPPYVIIPRLK